MHCPAYFVNLQSNVDSVLLNLYAAISNIHKAIIKLTAMLFALVIIALISGNENRVEAGQWCWSYGTPNPTSVCASGSSAELGIAMALEHHYFLWPEAGGPKCQANYWLGELTGATCLSYNSSACKASPTGVWSCAGNALLSCDTNEIRTATGCCVKGTAGCTPVIQQCRKTSGNPIDVLTGDKLETVVDYTTAGPNPLFFERKYRSNTNFTIARQKVFGIGASQNRPDIDTARTRFGRAWRSNFDAFLAPYGSLSNPTSGSGSSEPTRAHLITPEGDELAFIYDSATTPNWRPAYFNSTTGEWTAPRRTLMSP